MEAPESHVAKGPEAITPADEQKLGNPSAARQRRLLKIQFSFHGRSKMVMHLASTPVHKLLELHKESLCALDGSSHSLRVCDEHGIELGGELTLQDVADAAHGPEILRLRLEADCRATDRNQ